MSLGRGGTATADPDPPRDGVWRPLFRAVALLFVVFPIANVLSTNPDPEAAILALLGTALFGAVMLLSVRIPDRRGSGPPSPLSRGAQPRRDAAFVWASAAAVVLLIVVAVAVSLHRPDAGWFAFFYYASTAASTIRSSRAAIALMIASGVVAAVTIIVATHDPGGAFVQGLSVSVIGFTVYSAIAVRRTNRALIEARHELARLAVADERARIARDLHDTLGHSLSVIALKSELAGRVLDDDPARARAEIADIQTVARESLAAVRETIGGYRQPSLATELAGARSALTAAGIEGRVEPAPEGLPVAADAILGWAVREGVTNILRHGRAAVAEIRVESLPSAAAVEIRNDRRASDADDGPQTSETESVPGSGLAGLRERVAIVGGELEAGRLPDGGFRLRVSVPRG